MFNNVINDEIVNGENAREKKDQSQNRFEQEAMRFTEMPSLQRKINGHGSFKRERRDYRCIQEKTHVDEIGYELANVSV
jgi:hypothetical protein